MSYGGVRERAYELGYEVFGPDFTKIALDDRNSSIRNWARKFLERDGKSSKGGRPKQNRLFS